MSDMGILIMGFFVCLSVVTAICSVLFQAHRIVRKEASDYMLGHATSISDSLVGQS